MPRTGGSLLLAVSVLGSTAALAHGDGPRRADNAKAADPWNSVKLTVARNRVASHLTPFFASLLWWVNERDGRTGPGPAERVAVEKDATEDLSVPPHAVVHIRGSLAASLSVGDHSEVVIGGSVVEGARIEADGIVAIHVQGDVEGVVACHGMAVVWVGGDLRGQILTGGPSMHLHVKGDLTGIVRPLDQAYLLYVDIRGRAAASVLRPIDAHRYTELNIAVGSSDLGQGIHPLWTGPNGFVAVTGALP